VFGANCRKLRVESRCVPFHWGIEYERSVGVVVRGFMESEAEFAEVAE
jgi:hypothetical protein